MKTTLKISHTVIKRLTEATTECHGKLYGIFTKNNISILALQVYINESDNLPNSLPAELDFCGIFKIGGPTDTNWIVEAAKDVDVTDNPVYIGLDLISKHLSTEIIANDQLVALPYTTISDQDIFSQYVHLHLRGNIPIQCEATPKAIEEAFVAVRKMVTSGVMGFNFPNSKVYLLGNEFENSLIGLTQDSAVSDLCKENDTSNEGSKKKKIQTLKLDIIDVGLMKRNTKIEVVGSETKSHAPMCILDKKQTTVLEIGLTLDSLSVVNRQTKVLKLYEILVESAIRNLRSYEAVLQKNLLDNEDVQKMQSLQTFHFLPKECAHFITRIYPKNCTESDLRKTRLSLHEQLLLSQQLPVFRRGNKFLFSTNQKQLVNPHESVKNTDNGGEITVVKGKYLYYHYLQDNMQDNGWGCAYRSLQTLASWFKLQGFVDREVPTFKEIQKCLVDIGDKPRNFIDSRQWIGSTEVSFVLESLLGVTSRILFVNSGEEMATQGPELVNHFENHGSPIMIGGGVLAHTILGVDYNRDTGNLRFLILDPHYTGGEDLHVIVSKGWCGWKNVDFWDKKAHYNMCLPQVPRVV